MSDDVGDNIGVMMVISTCARHSRDMHYARGRTVYTVNYNEPRSRLIHPFYPRKIILTTRKKKKNVIVVVLLYYQIEAEMKFQEETKNSIDTSRSVKRAKDEV